MDLVPPGLSSAAGGVRQGRRKKWVKIHIPQLKVSLKHSMGLDCELNEKREQEIQMKGKFFIKSLNGPNKKPNMAIVI